MQVLKGNFETSKAVQVETKKQTLEDKFEAAATKRLGGSICYVKKAKVVWSK